MTCFFRQIQRIIDDDSPIQEGEEKLAALTAGERAPWAKCRQEFFHKGLNKISLSAIEGAVFFVALDDEEYNYDPVSTLMLLSKKNKNWHLLIQCWF